VARCRPNCAAKPGVLLPRTPVLPCAGSASFFRRFVVLGEIGLKLGSDHDFRIAACYSTQDIPGLLHVIQDAACICRHLELDPIAKRHLFIKAQRARCWWVRSALTYSVNAIEATNASTRAALAMIASGPLPFLGQRPWPVSARHDSRPGCG